MSDVNIVNFKRNNLLFIINFGFTTVSFVKDFINLFNNDLFSAFCFCIF